jgi:hypothetical protein
MVLDLFILQFSIFTHNKLYNTDYYTSTFNTLGLYPYISSTLTKDLGIIQHECNLPEDMTNNIFTASNVKNKVNNYALDTIAYMTYKNSTLPAEDVNSYSNTFNKRIDDLLISKGVTLNSSSKTDINLIKNQTTKIMKNEVYFISFDSINNSTFFQKLRLYLYKIYSYKTQFITIYFFLSLLILILEIKNLFKFILWFSSSLIAGGLLALIPSEFLLNTKFMDRLALSSPKIKLIFSTIIRDYLQSFINFSIYITVIGVFIFILNLVAVKFINMNRYFRPF